MIKGKHLQGEPEKCYAINVTGRNKIRGPDCYAPNTLGLLLARCVNVCHPHVVQQLV